MRIQAVIHTYDNRSGLNALLWSIYAQTKKPDGITIMNTGLPIIDTQVIHTINYLSKEIPIEIVAMENHKICGQEHFGLLMDDCFKFLKNKQYDFIWFFYDDCILDINCLRQQSIFARKEQASIPHMIEINRNVTELEPRYLNILQEKKTQPTQRGTLHGLLTRPEWVLSIDFKEYHLFEDNKIIKELEPYYVFETFLIHTKPTQHRMSSIYGGVEKLMFQ